MAIGWMSSTSMTALSGMIISTPSASVWRR